MRLTLRRCRRGTRTEQGAVAIVVAAAILALLVVTAMVLDFGLARMDRQVNKSAADNAVTAGIRGFDGGDANVYTFKGVCDALSYLRANVSDTVLAAGLGGLHDGQLHQGVQHIRGGQPGEVRLRSTVVRLPGLDREPLRPAGQHALPRGQRTQPGWARRRPTRARSSP